MALSGKTIIDLSKELDKLEYYKSIPPKTLGVEWVDKNLIPLIIWQ